MRDSSDQGLVARVASGDDQAFEEIFDRYGPPLLGFCVHMLGNREWGEDALQLTFVAAYKALCRGECDGALRPWLYAIARNRCLSELRSRREIPDSDSVSADGLTFDGPASLFARREQLREIVDDIQRLPADQRTALVLLELGDLSHKEIAAELGIRRDKVKALIFQAREGLLRGRIARERACSEVRERLANERGKAPARSVLRAHIDRCAPCQAFEREVRKQRAALALVLPVALSGKVKALMVSSAISHGSAGAGAAASGGSVSAAGAVAGGGAASAGAGSAGSAMVASALGPDALAGVGALTSSVSVATVAKVAAVVAVAVGVGGVTHRALESSPRPQAAFLAAQPKHAARLGSPLTLLVSDIKNPLAGAAQRGSQRGVRAAAHAGAPPRTAAHGVVSSTPRPFSSVNPAGVSAPSTAGASAADAATGTTSAPAASAPNKGSATTTAPSSGSSTATTTTTTTTVSSPTTSASPGTSGASPGNSGNSPGHTSGQDSGAGVTSSNGNGPPATPPGCVGNPSPGCAKK
jgi:RNA polymerase sigma factor (sigma-70 family)